MSDVVINAVNAPSVTVSTSGTSSSVVASGTTIGVSITAGTPTTLLSLPAATTTSLGAVIVGSGLSVSNGTISASDAVTSVAGRTGAVTLTTADISGMASYATLTNGKVPSNMMTVATTAAGGVVIVGSGLSVGSDGTLSATGGGAVTSVAGRTGAVTLVKGDVGLGNVDNTSDANKPVSTAQATAIGAKLALSGGAMNANAVVTYSDGTHDAEIGGWGFGVEITADKSQTASVEPTAITVANSSGSVQITAAGITFPNGSTQTTAPFLSVLSVYNLSNNVPAGSGDVPLVYDSVYLDAFGTYDTSTGRFVVPSNGAGLYAIQFSVLLNVGSAGAGLTVSLFQQQPDDDAIQSTIFGGLVSLANGYMPQGGFVLVTLRNNDTVWLTGYLDDNGNGSSGTVVNPNDSFNSVKIWKVRS
jgi:hypothetical protein